MGREKAKGALQILYERGWIDIDNLKRYTMNGSRDNYGNINLQYSLLDLIQKLPDFAKEETLLQYHSRLLGVKAIRSTKCHCEIAGEGIEYAWGAAKLWYRKQPLSQKRTKESFLNLVQTALSDVVLSKQRVRQFARRARNYMLAYRALDSNRDEINENGLELSETMIKKCVKVLKQKKSHRAAFDFDRGFIEKVLLDPMEFEIGLHGTQEEPLNYDR